MLDIKNRGLAPFVDFARVLALRYGVRETNTLERLRFAEGKGEDIKGSLPFSS